MKKAVWHQGLDWLLINPVWGLKLLLLISHKFANEETVFALPGQPHYRLLLEKYLPPEGILFRNMRLLSNVENLIDTALNQMFEEKIVLSQNSGNQSEVSKHSVIWFHSQLLKFLIPLRRSR
jgi:hypothetical protein